MADTKAPELSLGEDLVLSVYRCLLCLPHVGDARRDYDITPHLKDW